MIQLTDVFCVLLKYNGAINTVSAYYKRLILLSMITLSGWHYFILICLCSQESIFRKEVSFYYLRFLQLSESRKNSTEIGQVEKEQMRLSLKSNDIRYSFSIFYFIIFTIFIYFSFTLFFSLSLSFHIFIPL